MSDEYIPPAEATAARWLHPVHPDGRKFVVIFAVITAVFAWCAWETLAWPMGAVTIWCALFFRDPVRVTPRNPGVIVAPADGMITLISTVPPPRELIGEDGLHPAPVVRVSIFMSVFDVHINRAPMAGVIRRVVYISGKFLNADLDKASEENERQHILLETGDGIRIGFTQIAGLVARRIVPFIKPGDIVAAGQRFGLIRFGSRVDVYLPAGTQPLVAIGQRTVAGETVLAQVGRAEKAIGVAQ